MRRAALALALIACGDAVDTIGFERMKSQAKARDYGETPFFADGKVLQEPPAGTVPRERALEPDDPPPLDLALVERGRNRFEIFCAACHGLLGDGDSEVAEDMRLRRPPSLSEPRLRAYPARRIHDVIDLGFGLMPSYASALDRRDRWAVAEYVKALQLSQAGGR
jgi:mono/diheme cytochrome c family protein